MKNEERRIKNEELKTRHCCFLILNSSFFVLHSSFLPATRCGFAALRPLWGGSHAGSFNRAVRGANLGFPGHRGNVAIVSSWELPERLLSERRPITPAPAPTITRQLLAPNPYPRYPSNGAWPGQVPPYLAGGPAPGYSYSLPYGYYAYRSPRPRTSRRPTRSRRPTPIRLPTIRRRRPW